MVSSNTLIIRLVTIITLVVLGFVSGGVTPLQGQYFGRNQVQYETFDFRVLQTEQFDVYYYPDEEAAARDAARMAERWYARLSRILDHRFTERQPLVFYGSHPAFQQTTTLGGGIGEGTGGVTESAKQRVIMPLTGSYQETDHVLGHELVHAFQYDISGLGRSGGRIGAGGRQLASAPLWLIEGMAEYLSVGAVDAQTAMWLRDAALTGEIPSIERLTRDPRIFPYRYGHALWAYIGGRWGDAVVGQILRLIGQGTPYPRAFQQILGTSLDELSDDWQTAIRRAYLPLLAEQPEAREIARPLITRSTEGGRLNLGPSVSPDGRRVAFLSELSAGDIELFLANAETGEVIRRLQKGSAFDPHFQSLRYINSAGTWSPDGRQFAFSALRGGRDVLVIIDAERGRRDREIRIPDVTEITTPTWSPDGGTIVFAGIEGGVSDLYAFDLRTEQTRRLTQDLFANLHPSYSPDGSTIAFVTDAGAKTDLGTLRYSGYRIALLNLATGQTRVLPGNDIATAATEIPGFDVNNINPVWTRDGSGLYFVSNRSGAPNIYRYDLATEQVFRITGLFGGVSGITDISPAISTARNADRLLFTAFENNGYNIYALTTPEELAGTALPAAEPGAAAPLAAVLPPVPRPTEPAFNRVAALLADPTLGLPAPGTAWDVVPYRPRLSLDYLGQPQIGYATGVQGQGGLYGGISAVFSDLLGYHTVFGTVQAQGELDEIGFSTVYLNRKYRWNYGAQVQRLPYISLGQQANFDPQTGLLQYQILRFRTFNSNLQGITQYPFSQVQRVEFSGGYRRIAQDVRVTELEGPAVVQGGRIIDFRPGQRRDFELDSLSNAYNLFEASAALVYDNALFGYTSPFAGQRYRFEITPTFGELQFVQGLADYRRYLWLRPFTIAGQAIHFGRYGRDSEGVFFPLFLGQPSLVRGYFDLFGNCRSNPEACDRDALELLFGSRILVAKTELRFPLVRQLVLGPGIGFPPIEGFGFFDAGVAWARGTQPVFERGLQPDLGDRGLVTSAGVGARINLFGYVIVEVDYVNAFERDRGWHWQFALQPGF
jgi:Tol biopolymer transport system component